MSLQNNLSNQLLSRKEAATFLGVKESTLASWACRKTYPLNFVKVGRLVKYRLSELESFLEIMTRPGCSKEVYQLSQASKNNANA